MTIPDPTAPHQTRRGRSRVFDLMQSLLDRAEALFYLVVAAFLIVAGALVIGGTVGDLPDGGRELTNFLLELALLAALTIAFAVALYLLRRAPGLDPRTQTAS